MKDHNNRPDFNHWQDTNNLPVTSQIKRVYSSFYEAPKTMLMVSMETRIYRASICRYVAQLKDENLIVEVRKGFCEISKAPANYYSTNPKYFEDDDESLKEVANE
ncbi:hypothetical protein [Pseudotamlana agarivorans]|uniref:hypothetical protein n=1 Tax=Pseudotamlana agarivorans TaxID=481183 RepID=UPI00082B6A2B|nr:hypothetical protein [Tamlana agarivorans]